MIRRGRKPMCIECLSDFNLAALADCWSLCQYPPRSSLQTGRSFAAHEKLTSYLCKVEDLNASIKFPEGEHRAEGCLSRLQQARIGRTSSYTCSRNVPFWPYVAEEKNTPGSRHLLCRTTTVNFLVVLHCDQRSRVRTHKQQPPLFLLL